VATAQVTGINKIVSQRHNQRFNHNLERGAAAQGGKNPTVRKGSNGQVINVNNGKRFATTQAGVSAVTQLAAPFVAPAIMCARRWGRRPNGARATVNTTITRAARRRSPAL